MQTADSQGHTG